MFLLAYEDLAIEFGVPMLEQALRKFLSRQKFFPHPSEVREELSEMATKAKQEAAKNLPKLGCETCAPFAPGLLGYVIEQKPGQARIVTPCACRIAREKAKREGAA